MKGRLLQQGVKADRSDRYREKMGNPVFRNLRWRRAMLVQFWPADHDWGNDDGSRQIAGHQVSQIEMNCSFRHGRRASACLRLTSH